MVATDEPRRATMAAAKALDIEGMDTIPDVLGDFVSSLRARNRSDRTIESYCEAANLLDRFLGERGLPRELRDIQRTHVETFINDQLERWKPTTAAVRFRSLHAFFHWVERTEIVAKSPMSQMSPPTAQAPRIEIVTGEDMRALLKVCNGKTFEDYRDTALLRLFYDTGARMSEVVSLMLADLDIPNRTMVVRGKGGRFRVVSFGEATHRSMRYYLRARGTHVLKESEWLWLGARGQQLTRSGIDQLLRRRCREAGIKEVHAHQFRHSAAHLLRSEGYDDASMMSHFGWRSRDMLLRYGAALAEERAVDAYRRIGAPGDRL